MFEYAENIFKIRWYLLNIYRFYIFSPKDSGFLFEKCDNMQLKRMENIDTSIRFQRHLADHLFAQGYCNTAVQLAKSIRSGDNLQDHMGMIEIYQETLDIVEALKKGDFIPVEKWLQSIQFKYKKGDVKVTEPL